MKAVLNEEEAMKRFRGIIGLLKTINEEQTLLFKPEGMEASAMDPSHVAMIILKVPPASFSNYVVEEEETKEGPIQMAMNLTDLAAKLETVDPKQESLSLEYDKEKQKLNLNITTPQTRRRRRFSVTLLEPSEEEIPVPKILFRTWCRIVFDDWERAIKDAQLISEHISLSILEVQEEGIRKEVQMHFSSHGDAGDSFMAAQVLDGSVDEESKATYTLSYLVDFAKAAKPLAEVVKFSLSNDMPVRIDLEATNSLTCELYLAPCISP